jgi:hypothetical protein
MEENFMEDHVFVAGEILKIAHYYCLCHSCNKFIDLKYTEENALPIIYICDDNWGPNKMHIFAILRETRCPHCDTLCMIMHTYADHTHDPAFQYIKRQEVINNVINTALEGK